ncbi:Hg(II)-responsive transcriptional regulator [Alteromonas sp. R78001]|uniref:Hg(II)-responsive transcriptional regulator n=1 Tax=Alteromonas sp. R78001 TaxID=3093865 RepID=UPI00366DD2B4
MSGTIGKIAKLIGVNKETIRFYERNGLISQPQKPSEGYRVYPKETVDRIRFIKRAQELGFTLKEIESLLSLNSECCSKVEELAKQKLASVQSKLDDLKKLENVLSKSITLCQKNADNSACPIINALSPK